MNLNLTSLPKGFRVLHSPDGATTISYRTSGMIGLTIFLLFWLSAWTFFCCILAYKSIFTLSDFNTTTILMSFIFNVSFWSFEFFVLGYTLWYLRSVTTFNFYQDRLVIHRSLFNIHRQKVIFKKDVIFVNQVIDGGKGEDSFPSWGLIVLSGTVIKLLSRQKFEKCAWLGPLVAEWAEVDFNLIQE